MKQEFQYAIERQLFDDQIIFSLLVSCASLFDGKFDSGRIL